MNTSQKSPANRAVHGELTAAFGSLAFTLIEILLVIVLVSILMSIAAPAVSSMVHAYKLTQSAQLISGQLGYARQLALTKNHAVEVRFYRYGDIYSQGEDPTNASSGKFRAFQTFKVLETGVLIPLTEVFTLASSSIIMDSGSTLSTIIGKATGSTSVPSLTTGTLLNVSIQSAGLNYDAVAFRFLPDGSTTLPLQTSTQLWFITLHDLAKGDKLDAPPPNFITLQINPSNGKIRTYNP